eukprot:197044_1
MWQKVCHIATVLVLHTCIMILVSSNSHLLDDYGHAVSQYRFHFKSYHLALHNHSQWKWHSSHHDSINETTACSKQISSLCIQTYFTMQSLTNLKLSYTNNQQQKLVMDFWNDSDWSQVNIFHDTTHYTENRHQKTEKRHLLDDDDNGIFGNIARHIGNKVGIYGRPPCDESSSRCRIHLYKKPNFQGRSNWKGFFCEGHWDRNRLLKYGVNRRSISSAMVQGSPCCVMVAYNGDRFDGDMQAMFPRGAYRSMTMGIDSSMGMGIGSTSAIGRSMGPMAMGIGMQSHMPGMMNNELASMKIVHDCALTQRLMHGGMSGSMMGGMGGGMMNSMPSIPQMLETMMMMKVMFPGHYHHGHHKKCRQGHGGYHCVVQNQQKQLMELMQMLTLNSDHEPPVAISEHRRRIMDQHDSHVVGVKKCKLMYLVEICVTFDSIQSVISVDYIFKRKKEIGKAVSDPLQKKVEHLIVLLEETQKRLPLSLAPLMYGMIRNERLFAVEDDATIDGGDVITYCDTFILDWDTNKCNDNVLPRAYIPYAICVTEAGLIYFERRMDLVDAHAQVDVMFTHELDDVKLDIMNERDWSQIYETEKRKLCNYISMIKLCVEFQEIDPVDFKILIEY